MSTETIHMVKKKTLVPVLRFREFDGDIKETFFGNHYTFHTTNSLSRDKLNYDNGEVRNIHYGDIHTKFQTHFHLTKEYVPFINEDVDLAKIKEDSYCKIGDLVIADASEDYADIGKSIELIDINNEKLLAGLHTFLARPSSENTAVGYISYLLKSWKLRKQIMTIAQGTKVLSLSTGRVSKLKLNLPSLPEQQKIASFFSAVDEKIQQLTKKKELLEHYKKGVMQQLFSGKLRFKDADGKDYPEWEEKRLGEICLKAQSGGTPKSTNKEYYKGEIPFLAISDMTKQGKYLTSTSKKVSQLGINNSSSWLVPKGSLIYSMYASVGFVAINMIEIATSQAVMNMILKKGEEQEFIYYYLNEFRRKIHKYIETGTQGNINAQIVKSIKIPYPAIEEQQKIATYLSRIDTKIESVNQQITQTQTFKKGLLQQLFV